MSAELVEALEAATALPRLLVASDFDGVLATFVQDPADARPQEGTMATLLALADLPGTTTAVVSGRDLDTLTALTGLDPAGPVNRIGSHGAQTSRAGATFALSAAQSERLDAVGATLARIARAHPATRLEHKPAAIVLHTRGLSDEDAAAAEADAMAAVERLPGVAVLHGKAVIECSVVLADKGTALRELATEVGADSIVYLGDDRTDEDAFEAMTESEVSIKVGPGQTLAHHRIDGPLLVPEVLDLVLALRRATPS
ncbi:trehalose-phosphatase [Janibacter sp. G56]|uniref:trehalose-phosphatase n=1 Tax=Janibacter sp. G56 TaxID=3418717 RepID=UPI003D015F46